ncbi:peptide/nickel transport system ATP-binding protein [Lewinella marina]|uniref:ABC transporter ATP-binding protein n=1 Tax=Neolewinella marina TaxID=438751 RepID=UPI001431B62E|nr:ABC transporter ATP-binding protein [Neolewinella marina]NJB85565.1 peptide/nickel transport system ATP-binding protein [Neolewinella marina]
MSELLTVTDFSLSFPANPRFVRDLSFSVAPGESVGLVGPSGSGKSLTAFALLGLLPPKARVATGNALYHPKAGEPVDLLSLPESIRTRVRGREIAYIFQEPQSALNPVVSCGRQLREAIHRLGDSACNLDEAVAETLRKVGLDALGNRIMHALPRELSGGQLQRLLIAMALAGRPRLLIADEPTTALDLVTQAEIVRLLDDLRAEHDMGLLFIAHDEELIERVTDRQVSIRRPTSTVRKFPTPGAAAGANPTPEAHQDLVLQVSDLTIRYASAESPVIRDCSFAIRRGEWVGLIGPSGCGKSTIASWLVGLLPAEAGQLLAPGGSVPASASGPEIRRLAGGQIIFQDVYGSLNPSLTVAAALKEALAAESAESVDDLLNSVGLPPADFRGKLPHELSGGQRQRVAIARALAARPRVLICDEALSGLDVPLRREVVEVMERACRPRGVGVLFITHNLRLATSCTTSILLMENGTIVERGCPRAILQSPESELGRRLVDSLI